MTAGLVGPADTPRQRKSSRDDGIVARQPARHPAHTREPADPGSCASRCAPRPDPDRARLYQLGALAAAAAALGPWQPTVAPAQSIVVSVSMMICSGLVPAVLGGRWKWPSQP